MSILRFDTEETSPDSIRQRQYCADCSERIGIARRGSLRCREQDALSQSPDAYRLVIAPDRDLAERNRATAFLAQRVVNGLRDQELRIEILVERFEPRGEIHGIADHGIF